MKAVGRPITITGPGESELDDIQAPTEEQAKAFREGFAAHVAASPEFRQAVKELQHTQNPRPAQKQVERGTVEPAAEKPEAASETGAANDAGTVSETDAHDTIRGVPKMTYANGTSPLADAPAPGADEEAEEVAEIAEKPARRVLWAVVIGAALVLIGGAVWMLMAGPAEVPVQGKPSAIPVQSAGVTGVPTAVPGLSASEPSGDPTVAATSSVTATTPPTNTSVQSSTASVTTTATSTQVQATATPTSAPSAQPKASGTGLWIIKGKP